jgi:dihydropteroate synthase
MARLAASRRCPVVLMHMRGTPQTMQQHTDYADVVAQVKDYLLARAALAEQAGILREYIFLDPGIGFAKTTQQNLLLLKHLDVLTQTPYRVLVGPSRKRFIGDLTAKPNPADRLFGTAAAVALAAARGAAIVRVHDIAPIADVLKITAAITSA